MSTQNIKHKALQLGYMGCGVIPADAFDEFTLYLDKRIKSFPDSKALYEPFADMSTIPVGGKSIIVCTRRFNQYKTPDSLNGRIGRIYQVDGRLHYSQENRAVNEFETYLKTLGIDILESKISARWAAARAGLGKFGRNNFIYSAEHGSSIWIDAWVVDKELEYDTVQTDTDLPECSESCHKCVKACPTKALSDGFSMDVSKCVARLSFDTRAVSDENLWSQMGSWLYGCDDCQDVCPCNKDKFTETGEFPLLSEFVEHLQLENLLEMDEATYVNIVNPRFWYAGKDGLWLWKHNALRCMVNSGDAKYHQLIKKYRDNGDERLKAVAEWGCKKLGI
jgi:epoxyqueuosine reductase